MKATTTSELTASAAGKHMTIAEMERFLRQARALGAQDDDVPKCGFSAWSQTVKEMRLEISRELSDEPSAPPA
jgi:hypothetical protein